MLEDFGEEWREGIGTDGGDEEGRKPWAPDKSSKPDMRREAAAEEVYVDLLEDEFFLLFAEFCCGLLKRRRRRRRRRWWWHVGKRNRRNVELIFD
jgi:hypothetical protein